YREEVERQVETLAREAGFTARTREDRVRDEAPARPRQLSLAWGGRLPNRGRARRRGSGGGDGAGYDSDENSIWAAAATASASATGTRPSRSMRGRNFS